MRIEIQPGDTAWPIAEPLFMSVWPPQVREKLAWGAVSFAYAEHRVLVWEDGPELVGHVGFQLRNASWNGGAVTIGGIGGVITRDGHRRRGIATAAIERAVAALADSGADFAMLFCEPHNFGFYRGLGWVEFTGQVFCEQPAGRIRFDVMTPFVRDLGCAPRDGIIDLCGRPW